MTSAPGFPVLATFPVHWGDMDALGHVNNARYFTWFESARIALFRQVGVMSARDNDSGVGPILATATCDFIRPAAFPNTVVVGTRVSKVGRTSITMEYAVWPEGQPDLPFARGSSVAVMFDYRSTQKVDVPAEVRRRIEVLQVSALPSNQSSG
jgi:acyl-CoA thioester hydrolase